MLDGVSCVPQSTPKATAPRGGLHIEFRCVIFDRYSGRVREGRLSRLSRRFVGFVVQTSPRFVVQTSPGAVSARRRDGRLEHERPRNDAKNAKGVTLEYRSRLPKRLAKARRVREGRLPRLSRRFACFVVQRHPRSSVCFVIQTFPAFLRRFRGPDAPACRGPDALAFEAR